MKKVLMQIVLVITVSLATFGQTINRCDFGGDIRDIEELTRLYA